MISRRRLLSTFAAAVAAPALAEAPAHSPRPLRRGGFPAPPDAATLVAEARLGGRVSYVVADAVTGRVREQRDAGLKVPPASTAKVATALYALERLGPGFRFTTRLLATGPIEAGILRGDLVLVGSGDPTLSTDALGDLAAALAAAGVRQVAGRYLVHAAALPALSQIDPEQPAEVGYNPGLSGLNLNFNRVHFEWRQAGTGYAVTMDARAERFVPPVAMARMQVVTREEPTYTYAAAQGSDNWTVASRALGKGGSRWLPVRHPEAYAAEVFQTLARAQGIALPTATMAGTCPEGRTLAHWQSADLVEVLRDMLRHSTNLTAEAVGLRASGAATLGASGRAMTLWARERFGITAEFRDHSGLGGASRVSAADMVTMLATARHQGPDLGSILRGRSVGDPKRPRPGLPVEVAAKSGTLNFVSGLVGLAAPPGGREFLFAIYAADTARRDALPMKDREAPPGGRAWLGRARTLQGRLIERWAEFST